MPHVAQGGIEAAGVTPGVYVSGTGFEYVQIGQIQVAAGLGVELLEGSISNCDALALPLALTAGESGGEF